MFRKIILAFILLIIISSACVYWAFSTFETSTNYPEAKHIIIQKGSGTQKIMNQLEAEGLIKYPRITALISKYQGNGELKFGEYLFAPNLTPKQIIEKIKRGDVVVRKVTIPEGKSSFEIMEILGELEGLSGEIPANIPEGSILPQTYFYQYGDSYEKLIAKMQADMQTALQRMWEFRQLNIPIRTPEEAVILASIVEKETGVDGERGLVASVFTNRLRIGMPLQSDPTAIYGITGGTPLGRMPLSADMKYNSEYNTYINKGLPPTPICHPGVDAIEAVLNPPDTSYLYFVANGSGGHNFSGNLSGHNKNVTTYRKVQKATKSTKKKERMKSEMMIRAR